MIEIIPESTNFDAAVAGSGDHPFSQRTSAMTPLLDAQIADAKARFQGGK
jgi:hypothetical protein